MRRGPSLPPAHTENWNWQLDAACRGERSASFFDTDPAGEATAKKLCEVCPVAAQCLEYAMDAEEPYGIWGGLSPEERFLEKWNRPAWRRRRRLYAAGAGWRT
ncbi:WhiB family transcriptional regulator [Rhodococcus sp. BP-316]|jgi:WhiB family redox-sensing transcriptional regulator|uniref:WhiB family transcriptional regulator n=1 Tax=Rhodococcus sp. BP-316 TaxID=2739445 RepID=UPI001C9AF9F9|nr:WhiB family transcriptional regulator [Rhodococcus sp. BP-316]MBY6683126.1 WhiB family transcriptional regulator [Rhodococcus sp. BP-316]